MAGSKAARREEALKRAERARVKRIVNSLPVKPVPELLLGYRDLVPIFLDPDKANLSRTVRTRIAKAVMKGRKRKPVPLGKRWKHALKLRRDWARRHRDYTRRYDRARSATVRGAWMQMRRDAKKRGVSFDLTEDDYVSIWMSVKGAWDGRSTKPGGYCLFRKDTRKGWTKNNTRVGLRAPRVGVRPTLVALAPPGR